MRKAVVVLMTLALVTMAWPAAAVAAQQQGTGGVQGTARSAAQQPLGNTTIQLRNATTGQLSGSATSNAAGEFTFSGINPGNYVLEIVDQAGNILGTATVSVTAGAVTTATIAATAAGVAAVAAGTAGGLAGLFTGTSLLVITGVAAAGITTVVVATRNTASGSQ